MLDILSVVGGFLIAFVALPWLVLPKPKSARNQVDRIVINFIRWMAIVVVASQVLAALHLYETFTIVLLCAGGFWFSKLRPAGWTPSRFNEVTHHRIFDVLRHMDRREAIAGSPWSHSVTRLAADGSGVDAGANLAFTNVSWNPGGGGAGAGTAETETPGEVVAFRRRRPNGRPSLLVRFRQAMLSPAGILCLPIIGVIGYAAYLRFQIPLAHPALTPGDDYVHMTWASELANNNKIFANGIYPMGMACVLALVSKFAPLADISEITRYTGPWVGTLMILAIFYVALRLSRSPGGALMAAGTFGIFGSRADWHEPWSRQIGALPQEMCLVISLLGVGIVALAVLSRDKDHLWTVFAAGVAMSMTHPLPVAFFALLAPGVALVVGIFTRHIGFAVRTSLVAGLGAMAGFAYIPIALAVGVPFYAGIGGINPFSSSSSGTPGVVEATYSGPAVGYTPLSHWAMGFTAVGIIGGLALVMRRPTRARGATLLGLAALSVALLVAYNPTFLGLSHFYGSRTANIAGPQISLAFAAGLGALSVFLPRVDLKSAAVSVVAGLVCLVAFAHYFPNVPRPFQPIEYDDAADVAQTLVDHSTPYTYTMVGVPEQRQRGEGLSYFVELWVFARDVRLSQAEDPSYQLPIPTPTVYIFVEKKPFPQIRLAPLGATEEYYRDPLKRDRIETIAYQWAQTYMKFHTNMTVYYDDDKIVVYKVTQTPDKELAQSSPQFKDYRWAPGRLFNSGPTNPLRAPIP